MIVSVIKAVRVTETWHSCLNSFYIRENTVLELHLEVVSPAVDGAGKEGGDVEPQGVPVMLLRTVPVPS